MKTNGEASITIGIMKLKQILLDHDSMIAEEDVPGLMSEICGFVSDHGPDKERSIARKYADAFIAMAYCDDCESSPCECNDTPFVRVEFGNDFVDIPKGAVDAMGSVESAFEFATGVDSIRITRHSWG